MYPDSWKKERFTMVKNAVSKNVWCTLLYDEFLDGDQSHWVEGNSVFHYLKHCVILALVASLHDILPLVTYAFVCMLPLWRTPTHHDQLQCLVAAIHTNHHVLPPPNRVMSLLSASRCENPKCWVKEFTKN
jgi:hypothetical protein